MKALLIAALLFGSMIIEKADARNYYPDLPVQTMAQHKPALVLYYLPWCPYSQKVLDYLKQIHKSVPLRNLQNDPQGKEELRKKGGKMQVPCLFIDGQPLYESNDIIKWLSAHKEILDPG